MLEQEEGRTHLTYTIERTMWESKAQPERKLQERMEKSRPTVKAFFKELTNRSLDAQNPPQNKLKDAMDYALKRHAQLSSWLENPCIPINNQMERANRPVTVGRKNSLFIGAPRGRAESCHPLYDGGGMQTHWNELSIMADEDATCLPTHRASEGYLSLMPGILNLTAEKTDGKKVTR